MVTKGKHVILGGLGNMGIHMQRTLLSHGLPICVIDRNVTNENVKAAQSQLTSSTSTSASTKGDISSIQYIKHNLGFDKHNTDSINALKKAIQDADTVYNMVTPDLFSGTVYDHHQSNHHGVKALIDICRKVGVPKLVHASSIAVSNHTLPSVNENEESPLPPLDTYQSAYDLSKRLGEECVLEADDGGNFRTCALRCGGLIAGPNDFIFRRVCDTPGEISMFDGARIDYICAEDFCRALLKASKKLDESESKVGGRALYVSKCRAELSPSVPEVRQKIADEIGWTIKRLPDAMMPTIRMLSWIQYLIFSSWRDDKSRVGVPNHILIDYGQTQKTFDNSLGRRLLDFQPELTWEQGVENVVRDYLLKQGQSRNMP